MLDSATVQRLETLGGAALVARLAGIALATVPERLADLQSAFSRQERDGIRTAAHALRSTSSAIGARAVFACATELETAAPEESFPALGARLESLGATWDSTRLDLEALAHRVV